MATPVVTEIVERIAANKGVDPLDLDTRLYDVINVDALEALTNGPVDRQPRSPLRVKFTYYGYAVTVDGTGEVTIDDQSAEGVADASRREGAVGN